ncbi:substrate-binding periplasmic protein [Oligoflexus tunisiensis]|uniref:substrate-binding periplasmic protein n=1 Tax=Oligoflexus tunisiensis TaxID=708132 RepID=UPI00159F0A32|nr:transporter substrate-binding domain-containing protein [Oligoflexus tunisiensis]
MVELRYILMTLLLANQVSFGAEAPQPTIRINDATWPPYFYQDRAPGQKAGLAKDIIQICLPRMKRNFEYVQLPIERMQNLMQSGEIDINFFSYKKERESFVTFGKELAFSTAYQPVVRKDANITIQSLADFDKYKLGHTIGLRYAPEFWDYIQKRKQRNDLDETPSNESNLKKLLAGRIDTFVADASSIRSLSADMGVLDRIRLLDFRIYEGDYYLSLSKKSPRVINPRAFVQEFDHCLADLKKDGTYCKILQTYQLPCVLK